jgi:nicotinamide mononucleotide transporter
VNDWLTGSGIWESAAVIAALAYVWLAAKENIWCWFFALVSTAIYTLLFWNVSLLMESALNIYYLLMAIYGWWQWQGITKNHHPQEIHRWPVKRHLLAITGIVFVALASGWLLERYTGAALPYLDSFTTWAAVFTTWMVARKVLENWLYWIVIDAVSIYLYLDRELYQTAVLYLLYVGFALFGWYSWKRSMQQRLSAAEANESICLSAG